MKYFKKAKKDWKGNKPNKGLKHIETRKFLEKKYIDIKNSREQKFSLGESDFDQKMYKKRDVEYQRVPCDNVCKCMCSSRISDCRNNHHVYTADDANHCSSTLKAVFSWFLCETVREDNRCGRDSIRSMKSSDISKHRTKAWRMMPVTLPRETAVLRLPGEDQKLLFHTYRKGKWLSYTAVEGSGTKCSSGQFSLITSLK